MENNIQHSSPFLNQNFKGYQGMHPSCSEIVIYGLDANYRRNFDSLSKLLIEQFDLYFNDPVKFMELYRDSQIHTPLLLEEYMFGEKTGSKYHETFQKICQKVEYISNSEKKLIDLYKSTSFVELLNFPTMPKLDKKEKISAKEYKFFLSQDYVKNHVIETFLSILSSTNKVKVFIPPSVINLITPILKQIAIDRNLTDLLELIQWLKDSNNRWQKYEFKKNIVFYQIYHLSARFQYQYTDIEIERVANFIIE